MQKVYRYVHENKFPELKDKNVTYLLKICSGRSKQSVEFLLQQKKGTTVMFKCLSRKFEIKLGLSKEISQGEKHGKTFSWRQAREKSPELLNYE